MCNKTISWNDNWMLIFICFEGRLLLEPSASSYNRIVSYPNAEVDKKFFKSWVLHIPHCLRDLLWKVKAWSSIDPIFSSLLMIRASSSSRSLLKLITSFWNTFLEWMNSTILGGHSRWPSPLLHSSLFLLPLHVFIWFERLLWLHGLCILDLHILQLVSLGHILTLFFPSNSLKFRKTFNSVACNR